MRSKPAAERRVSATLAALGLVVFAAGTAWRAFPPSEWLLRSTPDGVLEAGTARFVDLLPLFLVGAGFLLVAVAASTSLRRALAATWQEPAAGAAPSRWIPALALAAGALRLAVATQTDAGLGDDGARIVWLEHWWRDPQPIWNGFWAPGHLYVQALFRLLLGDAIRAGVALSAVASTGMGWILGRRAERVWGRSAAILAVLFVALSPVSVAYGATADINPFFAFCIVASVAAALRAGAGGGAVWLAVAWVSFAFASWSRFETFLLAPAVAAMLWPRRRVALLFGAACLVPSLAWAVADWLSTGHAARVVIAVEHDPALRGARASFLFSFLGAKWQSFTLPLLVLGPLGIVRAVRARHGREWIAPLVLHTSALAAAMWISGAGTQARYFILGGGLLGAYAAAAIGGVWQRHRRTAAVVALAALALFVATPSLYSGEGCLWICRDAHMRAVVDAARAHAGEDHVVWIAERSAYFYACRTRIPIERYHALGRADDSPEQVLSELRDGGARAALACVEDSPRPGAQWDALRTGWQGAVHEIAVTDGYRFYRLKAPAPLP